MEQFQVPQRKVRVRVLLDGGLQLEGEMFAPESGPGGDPGRLSDRLNDPAVGFIPLSCPKQFYLVNKETLLSIQLAGDEVELETPEIAGSAHPPVQFCLGGGAQLAGELLYAAPPERQRLVDYLNDAPMFIPLSAEGRVTLVNRKRICRVVGG